MGWLKHTMIGRWGHRSAEAVPSPEAAATAAPTLTPEVLRDPRVHERVEEALRQLKAASGVLEQQFCVTCTTLSALNDRGRALVSGSERLVDIASGKKSGIQVLLEGMGLVEPPLTFLSEYRERFEASKLLDRLIADRARIDECIRAEGSIDRILEPLRTVNTLFKVVAAPLGANVQAIFESLVEELGELMDSVDSLVGARFEDLAKVREVLDAMTADMRAQQAHWTELATQRSAMQATLRELEGQLVANAQRETKIGAASHRIAESIEQVVTGLQWQDIISQKLDHSSKSLTALIGRLRSGDADPATINRAARVEWAQVNVARNELAEAERAIVEGIGRVREILSQSDDSAVMLGEFELLTTSSNGMVQLLLESIDSVDAQIESAVRTSNESMRTIRQIGESASALTAAVRELSERTLLVGMNAQVQSCKVQQGAGLGVLSSRTSDISREVARVGDAVARKLDAIVTDLRECGEIFAGLLEQSQTHRTAFREGREQVESSLHSVRDEALRLVQSTGGSIEEIERIGAGALSATRFRETMEPSFSMLLEVLGTLIEATGGHEARFGESEVGLDATLRSYTMESERQIFAAVGAGAAAGVAVATARHDTSIELFGDDEPSAGGTTSDKAASPHQAAAPDPALGENVELF